MSTLDGRAIEIAIVCALPKEAKAVLAVFDRLPKETTKPEPAAGDENGYSFCLFEGYPVVVAHMPPAVKGPSTVAARVAVNLKKSFPQIKLALVVGICGGVPDFPSESGPLHLGDVVISDSITPYDHGKRYAGSFERKPALKSTDMKFASFLSQLDGDDELRAGLEQRIVSLLSDCRGRGREVRYPGVENDHLFQPKYVHKHRNIACITCNAAADSSCESARHMACAKLGCEQSGMVSRPATAPSPTGTRPPSIHIGTIGSGHSVMKSGIDRDQTAGDEIIAFEMEGAGLLGEFPCVIVIKGVADYADSHKNNVWHNYASGTAACCARAFLEEFWRSPPAIQGSQILDQLVHHSPERFLGSQETDRADSYGSEPHSPIWSVKVRPLPIRDQTFVGRKNELTRLEAMYLEPGCMTISLHGPPGVGKSKLGLEFAVLLREKYPDTSIFWVQASDAVTFDIDVAEIGRQLSLSSMVDGQIDLRLVVKRLLTEAHFGRWLLIIDNVDDQDPLLGGPTMGNTSGLSDFIPKSPNGCTLITTRDKNVASKFSRKQHILGVPILDDGSASRLLTSLLAAESSASDIRLVRSFLKRLAYHPLAIVQAAAYITQRSMSVSEYVRLLDDREENVSKLLEEDFEDGERMTEGTNSIILRWRITFEDIVRRHDLARQWLCLVACVDFQNIPETFLPEGETPMQRFDARGLLTGYSVLERREVAPHGGSPPAVVFDMQRLVHLACRSWLRGNSALKTWEPKALITLLASFPDPTYANRSAWSLYLPHATRLLQSSYTAHMEAHLDLTALVGKCLFLDGKYQDAVARYTWVVEHRLAQTAPASHLKLLQSYHDLAEALERRNRPAELKKAMEYNQKALEGYLKTLGPTDPLALASRATQASVERRNQRWEEAKRIDAEVLQARSEVLGPGHRDTLSSMAELASDHQRLDQFKEAEDLLSQAAEGQRMVLGEDDPQYLSTQARLASLYRFTGRLGEAERLETDVMNQRKKILGIHHPETLRSMANLGSTYRKQARLDDAEKIETDVLRLRLSVLGEDDSDTLQAMGNLSATYRSQSKYGEAEALEKHALEVKRRVLGDLDPSTLATISSLAATYRRWNRHSQANALSKEAMKGCQRTLREDHQQTQNNMMIVARIFMHEERFLDAIALVERVIAKRTKATRPNQKLIQEARRLMYSIVSQQRRSAQKIKRPGG